MLSCIQSSLSSDYEAGSTYSAPSPLSPSDRERSSSSSSSSSSEYEFEEEVKDEPPSKADPEDALPASPRSVMEIARRWPGRRGIVPQPTYFTPRTQSAMDPAQLQEPIMFYQTNPDRCGFSCSEALLCRISHLVGRDEPVFTECGPAVSLRILVRRPLVRA